MRSPRQFGGALGWQVWSARVAEREPRMPAHAEFVICEQSIERDRLDRSKQEDEQGLR